MQQHDTDLSGLVISDEVLATIAVTAARDVEGVTLVAVRPVDLLSRFLQRETGLKYVRINGNQSELNLALSLRVKTSAKIAVVSSEVQRAVKTAVQNMTGKTVGRVNLRIVGADAS